MSGSARAATYWRRTGLLTVLLLAVWFVVTFGVSYLARELDFDFFGVPFSFYMAAQGAVIVYVLIVLVYVKAMRRLDREPETTGRDG